MEKFQRAASTRVKAEIIPGSKAMSFDMFLISLARSRQVIKEFSMCGVGQRGDFKDKGPSANETTD
jgi:hypothetical protein